MTPEQTNIELVCTVTNAKPNTILVWDVMEDPGTFEYSKSEFVYIDPTTMSTTLTIPKYDKTIGEQKWTCRNMDQDGSIILEDHRKLVRSQGKKVFLT